MVRNQPMDSIAIDGEFNVLTEMRQPVTWPKNGVYLSATGSSTSIGNDDTRTFKALKACKATYFHKGGSANPTGAQTSEVFNLSVNQTFTIKTYNASDGWIVGFIKVE